MRGNAHARRDIEGLDAVSISAVAYMETLQEVRANAELRALKRFMLNRVSGMRISLPALVSWASLACARVP